MTRSATVTNAGSEAVEGVRDRNSRRVLHAVREFVEEHGIEAASMRRMAAEAGVSVRTLYNHFGDRRAMLRALVLASLDEIDLAFDDLQATSPIERMWEATSVAVDTIVGSLSPAVLTPVLDDHEMLLGLSHRWRLRDLLCDEIRAAQRAGQLYQDVEVPVLVEHITTVLDVLFRGWAAGAFDEAAVRAGALHSLDVGLLAIARPRTRATLVAHARALSPPLPLPDVGTVRQPAGARTAAGSPRL